MTEHAWEENMRKKQLQFTKKTDRMFAGALELISLQCVARAVTEANALTGIIKHTASWPVPFYQEKEEGHIYFERRVADEILDSDVVVRASGKRRTMDPRPGYNSGAYSRALRLHLTGKKLWTPKQLQLRGTQMRVGSKIKNPPLPWPKEPSLFDAEVAATRYLDLDSEEVRAVAKVWHPRTATIEEVATRPEYLLVVLPVDAVAVAHTLEGAAPGIPTRPLTVDTRVKH